VRQGRPKASSTGRAAPNELKHMVSNQAYSQT
jgi:hypothetical protein